MNPSTGDIRADAHGERFDGRCQQLLAAMDLLEQSVVIVDDERGEATLNAAAARLLELGPGVQEAREVVEALRRLQSQALDQDAVEEVFTQLIADPQARIDGVTWTFDSMPTHLRVTTSPIDQAGLTGRVWVFDDLSVQMAALAGVQDARARYRLLAEHASDIVFRGSPEGVLEWVSESVTDTLGWQPADLRGRRLADLMHPDDFPTLDEAFREAEGDGHGGRFVHRARFTCKDGSSRWLELSSTTLVDEHGVVTAHIGSAHDVQGEVEAFRELEQSRSRLRAISDGMLDPQVLLAPIRDADGVITDFTYIEVNRVTCEYLGVAREQLVGTSLLASSPGVRETGLFDLYVQAMESDKPVIVDDFLYDNEILGLVRRYDVRANRVAAELSLTWRDVTDRFEAQRAIAESEERFRLLAQNATDIVAHVRHGTVVWMSPSVADQFRVAVEAWVGRSALELVHADDVAALQSALAAVDAGDTSTVRVRMQAPGGGTQHWVDARMQQYFDRDGRPDGLISSIRVVDDLVRAEAELDRRARYDDLTGLPNRGEAVATFARLTRRAQRTGERIAALFCDLDLFKSINDVHGHAAGDAVLATIAQRLTAGIRTDDTAARMGGDEFLALLVGVHGLDDATAVAEKLRESAQSPISYQGIDLQVTLSIGVALAEPGEDIDALMARADEAMYEAKKSGRNQVVAIA